MAERLSECIEKANNVNHASSERFDANEVACEAADEAVVHHELFDEDEVLLYQDGMARIEPAVVECRREPTIGHEG